MVWPRYQVGNQAPDTGGAGAAPISLLAGLEAHAVFEWRWADPVAALVIAAIAASMAKVTWEADSLEDTCCT
jgi:hypothetical protein